MKCDDDLGVISSKCHENVIEMSWNDVWSIANTFSADYSNLEIFTLMLIQEL